MIGSYWATGISVRYGYSGEGLYGWSASVRFYDDGWVDDAHRGMVPTQGTLQTRYTVTDRETPGGDGLSAAVDAVKADAERLGITWQREQGLAPSVYCDHEDGEEDPPGWRELVDAQSVRLGWKPVPYSRPAAAQDSTRA
jgi:hypothetical protein